MEELSADDLQQLEEQLYSQVHHSLEIPNSNNNDQTKNDLNPENSANTSKFLSKRYWTKKGANEVAAVTNIEPKNKFQKPNNSMKKNQNQPVPPARFQGPAKQPNHTSNNNNNKGKVRNPFAQPQGANNKNGSSQTKQNNYNCNPLAEKLQKIQRMSQFHNKKQKANNARAKALANPKVVETISLDDDDDEVIVVPLPPTPVVAIDDSDEEIQGTTGAKSQTNETTNQVPVAEIFNENSSRCASPASVMSHDDFIGQGDRHRLLVVNNNADSFLAQESRSNDDDVECIGTFIKPQASIAKSKEKGAGKQDFSVAGTEFRAVDVYESESDIVSDGVYSKGSSKTTTLPATSIQNPVDNSDDDDDLDDISQNPTKTKRLRKRRASASQRSAELIDSDDNDGVADTGVPYIYRGQAIENQKSKKKRKRLNSTVSAGRMSDTEFVATLNSLAQGDDKIVNDAMLNSESDSHDNDQMPTARDIAEQVLNAPTENEVIELPSTSAASVAQSDEAIPAQVADDVEKILSKINQFQEKKSQEEDEFFDENAADKNASIESHTLATSDISTTVVDFESSINEAENDEDDDKIKYFIGYSPANFDCLSDGFGWNEEMRRFYNCSWGGEDFGEQATYRFMKRSPHLWRISNADRFPSMLGRSKREKCMNCLTFGHSRAKCPKPKRPLVCYMCGQSGHLEARCPNTRCLRCGSETMSFVPSCKRCMYWNNHICPICKLRGHSLNNCPDKWRRYHSTTNPNEFPNPHVVYNRRRFCCFCGMRGHLADECRKALHRSEYPMIASEIKSFEKSYDDVLKSPYPPPGIKCRLLFDPNLIVNFTLAEKTTRSQAYGRFLNAVGLGKLIGAKNINSRQKIISPAAVTITGLKTPEKPPQLVSNISQTNTTTSNASQQNTQDQSKTPATATATITTTTAATEAASTSRLAMPPPPAPSLPSPMDFDSDSNYSFSEHFEVSSTVDAQQKTTAPLPDFIPLGGGDRFKETTDVLEIVDTHETGISAKFVEAHSDDDENHEMDVVADASRAAVQNKACQAKIFIDNERYRYFQSKDGQEYLCKVLPEHELTGSLEKTSAGFALFLTGLPKNQEKFQQALLQKYEALDNTKVQQLLDNQVPKNVKPLIRFLRDSINQLYSNLGSATDLFKKMYDLEKLQTKVGTKSADRIRRTLNMIFLGQAGLNNGDAHLEILLKALRTLLGDFEGIEKTPQKMREEINASWRMLFTPYDHKRYANLLTTYIQLPAIKRNRMPALQIDANILGNSVLDVKLSKEQKERLNDFAKNCQTKPPPSTISAVAEKEPTVSSMLLLNVFVPGQEDDPKQQVVNKKIQSQNKTEKLNSTNNESEEAGAVTTAMDVVQQENEQQQEPMPENNKPNIVEESSTLSSLPTSNANSNTQNDTSNLEKAPTSALEHSVCQNLLTQIENSLKTCKTGARIEAGKTPSRFWSCKSQEYLLEIIEFAKLSNSPSLDRLENLYKQAAEGRLSFASHADVLKLFNRTVKK